VSPPTLTEIVINNPTVEEEDLKLLFDKRLDVQSQLWFLSIGFLVGLISPTAVAVIALLATTWPLTLTSSATGGIVLLFIFEGAMIWALRYTVRTDTPPRRHEIRLKDYLEARKLIRSKPKPS